MRRFFSILTLTLGSTAPALAAPLLRIGAESADQPISFVDAAGRPAGFTAELLHEMGRAGLTNFVILPAAWGQLLEEFRAGRIDVLANVALTEERLRDMDLSIGHASVHGITYTRPDRPPITKTADFAGKKIGTLAGSISLTNALAHGGWGATILPFISPQAAIEATARGECDGVLLIHGLDGKYVTDPHGLRREFVDDIVHLFRFAVHKGDTVTLARLNDALDTVRHNGAFDRIYDQWIGPIEPHPIRLADLRPHAKSIALGLLALLALIWWQRHMLARVSRHARALHESEERFHRLVDAAFEGWVIHHDGTIVLVNAAYAATFGYTPAELIGKPVLDLTSPEERPVVAHAIATGRTSSYESVGLRKDGTRIPVVVNGQTCTFHGKPARIAAVRDLTAQKQAAADHLVISKLESTGILAGGIAHDFNNLLAMLVLNVDMALATERLSASGASRLQAAKQAADAAKNLTLQLIAFAEGHATVRQPADIAALLQKTVALALTGSNLRSDLTLAPDLWRAEIDAGQIERALGNLVLNAREAMPGGGVLTLRAANVVLRAGEIPTLPAGDYLRLDVADHGYGISADALPKIFDPYFSTKERGTQKGMGLGLTISHAIIQQHGGTLTVDSTLGAGTTFHVYLPATQKPLDPPPPAPPAPAANSARILVMDDEDGVRLTLGAVLQHGGYMAELTADGQAAVDAYRQAQTQGRPFAAVILDLTVRGGMGGLETLHVLLTLDPAVKAIVISGYANEAVLRDHAQHGFRAALAKPFDLEKLHTVLARVVGG